jgi:hypothetical protein
VCIPPKLILFLSRFFVEPICFALGKSRRLPLFRFLG